MQLQIFLNVFVLILLGFGIISLTVILQGWFGHMTASGNDDKVLIAKYKMIKGAISLAVTLTLFTVGKNFIETTDIVMAENYENNENFDRVYTTEVK